MTYLDILKNNYTNFKEIVFSPLYQDQIVIGWEAIAYTNDHFAIGGGTAVDKNTALANKYKTQILSKYPKSEEAGFLK